MMATCSVCGSEFDVSTARRSIGRKYGAGEYDDFFPEGDVCIDCANDLFGEWQAAANELRDLMGPENWYDD